VPGVPEPWATRLRVEGRGEVFLDERSQWPDGRFATTVVVARRAFLEQHPELIRRVLAAHLEAVRLVAQDPLATKRLVSAALHANGVPELTAEELDQALRNVEITSDPLPATIVKQAERAFALGLLGE